MYTRIEATREGIAAELNHLAESGYNESQLSAAKAALTHRMNVATRIPGGYIAKCTQRDDADPLEGVDFPTGLDEAGMVIDYHYLARPFMLGHQVYLPVSNPALHVVARYLCMHYGVDYVGCLKEAYPFDDFEWVNRLVPCRSEATDVLLPEPSMEALQLLVTELQYNTHRAVKKPLVEAFQQVGIQLREFPPAVQEHMDEVWSRPFAGGRAARKEMVRVLRIQRPNLKKAMARIDRELATARCTDQPALNLDW